MAMKTTQHNATFYLCSPRHPPTPATPDSSLSAGHSATTIVFLTHTSRIGPRKMDGNENNVAHAVDCSRSPSILFTSLFSPIHYL
jgi:hypothetical protein